MSDTAEAIEAFILKTLAEVFNVPADRLSGTVTLEDLGIDSLGGVELSLAVKKRFGVAFVAGEITVEFSIGDIARLAEKKLAEQGTP
jgi:acyl carrier protein